MAAVEDEILNALSGYFYANYEYTQFTSIIRPDTGNEAYAKAAFTSGGTFNPNDWQNKLAGPTFSSAKTLWLQGERSSVTAQRGNPNRPFATLTLASIAAQSGDLIIVRPGGPGTDAQGRTYYTADFTDIKNVQVVFLSYPGLTWTELATRRGLLEAARAVSGSVYIFQLN